MVKKLGVESLPALVGWTSNGQKHILKIGISVKVQKYAVHDRSALLDGFEKKNKRLVQQAENNIRNLFLLGYHLPW